MRLVIQRVLSASVRIDGKIHGEIEQGFLVLVGIREGDSAADVQALADKCAELRVFEDANGKMNLSLADISGGVLAVSNFTLYADSSHGRRPSFSAAARPETALPLYELFCAKMREKNIPTATGVFGAEMKITLLNDGPVTIIMESENGRVLPV